MALSQTSGAQSRSSSQSGSDRVVRFRELSERVCAVLGEHGIPFRPYVSEELPDYSQLPSEMQALATGALEEFLAICGELTGAGESASDSRRFLWRALSRLRMPPRPDIIDQIDDDDVVELYMPNYVQVFRNLNFFKYVSCTLEELVSRPVWDLAKYPPEIVAYLSQVINDLMAGKITETFVPAIGPYVVEETAGIDKHVLEVRIKQLSPILVHGQGAGMVVINRSRIIR